MFGCIRGYRAADIAASDLLHSLGLPLLGHLKLSNKEPGWIPGGSLRKLKRNPGVS